MEILLETQRLILRRYKETDLMDLYEYLSDPVVVKYEPYRTMSLDGVKENLMWRISTHEMIAVVLKESNKMIGNLYLGDRDFQSKELGYVFNRSYWGKGFAEEACRALIKRSFSEGAHRLYSECDPNNTASWKLLEKLGFIKEAHFIQNVYFFIDEEGKPLWKDTFVYSLLNQ